MFTLHQNDSLQNLTQEYRRLAESVHAANTRAAYACDWASFTSWCNACSRCPLPASPETVALYLTDLLRGHRISTGTRRTFGISFMHRRAGFPSPFNAEVAAVLAGAQRLRHEQPRQKSPITVEQLRQISEGLAGPDPRRARNRALLLFGFASALRRCSLVALNLADLRFVDQGLLVHIRSEKQDQAGKGRFLGVVWGAVEWTCPVLAIRAWLRCRGDAPGPLFTSTRHGRVLARRLHRNTVGEIVKTAVQSIGLDPAPYAGHSLRAGFVTAAVEAGVNEFVIASQTGHRSLSSLRRYFRSADPFRVNASGMIGL